MRRPANPDDHTPSATPMTPGTSQTNGSPSTYNLRALSANHVSRRSPSPFEASTTRPDRTNSIDVGSTTQRDLYDATPARELGPSRPTIPSVDTSDEDESSSDVEDDITNGVQHISLGLPEDDDHESAGGDISSALQDLDLDQQAGPSSFANAPYSMRDEQLPAEPYYEQGFQNALKTGTQLAGQVATCLQKCPVIDDPESSLHKLLQDALKLSEYKSPTTRTIGIIGKSSLINSLLQVDELALTGSDGTAVTAFATEYRYQPAREAPKFTITAYCLSLEEIDENLRELLEDFRKPHLINHSDITADELKAAEDRSEAAKTIFQTAFGNFDDFSIEKVVYEEGGFENAFECLKTWAHRLKWPSGTHNGKWEASANTEQKCQRKTAPFHNRGLWPFVKRVVIYLKSPVLRNGLVLADLPGYHDVNFARVAAARKFQSTCDEIFVVTNIKRGVDDPIIKDVIREMEDTAAVGKVTRPNVTVICSHAGDLGSAQDKRKLKAMVPDSVIKHAQRQINKVGKRNGQFSDAKRAYQEAEMNMNGLLIQARNEKVKANLQAAYAEHFSPKLMPVFCIDNVYYQEQEVPQAVALSGIPDLRRYCLSLAGRALFRSADIYLETSLPALINSLEIWLDAAHTAGTQSFSNILDAKKVHEDFDSMLEDWDINFNRKCRDNLRKPCNRKEAAILADACSTAESWNGMYHTSYIAWVRHNGTYSTPSYRSKCWNTELVTSLNDVLTPYWVSFDSEVENDLDAISNELQAHLERFQRAAKDAKAPNGLIRNLAARQRLVEAAFGDSVEKFMQGFRLIKHNATSGNSTSYMLSYMHPVYEAGQRDYGPGVTGRDRRRIYAHVSNSAFVTTHSERVCNDLKELAEQTVDSLSEKVHLIIDATDRDLEAIQAPDAALLDKHPDFGERVEEMLRTARTELESIDVAAAEAREDARHRGYI